MRRPPTILASLLLVAFLLPSAPTSVYATTTPACPWVAQARTHAAAPLALATQVLAHMTLSQKAATVVLRTSGALENTNTPVPALCIPALTLDDGTSGVANSLRNVTQFPSQLAVGATFDTGLAYSLGTTQASQMRAKGIEALQAPDLNLSRSALGGRNFETYGEDPTLAANMGVAAINGIQSTGEIALAKHLGVYTQEEDRVHLTQVVAPSVLSEIYNLPFEQAVTQAHVGALMCSYGQVGTISSSPAPTCSDPALYSLLRSWGFAGFVRSDAGAVSDQAAAFNAGLSMIKPGDPATVIALVRSGAIPTKTLNSAVLAVLTSEFAAGIIAAPLTPDLARIVTSPAANSVALQSALESAVLLKNDGVLPLVTPSSIAVIGLPANSQPAAGAGSSYVPPSSTTTPLAAITSAFPGGQVTYAPGSPVATLYTPFYPTTGPPLLSILTPSVDPSVLDATNPGTGSNWNTWGLTVTPDASGHYQLNVHSSGDMWLYLDGAPLANQPGLTTLTATTTADLTLTAGRTYQLSATWYQEPLAPTPSYTLDYATPQIDKAVALAKQAKVVVVFASSINAETFDSATLSLPGDQNALIAAVAAVNPNTVVVLNTGGAVTMPWLPNVAAVLEAWYPGDQGAKALAELLSGVSPSGHLPITFPSSDALTPTPSVSQFPGVQGVTTYSEGLLVGYRWYQATNTPPLFPFGYGLTYSTFALASPTVELSTSGAIVSVPVTNTGNATATDTVQAYLSYPALAGEPPLQLRAFTRVTLDPHQSTTALLSLSPVAFQSYSQGALSVLPGTFQVRTGDSSAALSTTKDITINQDLATALTNELLLPTTQPTTTTTTTAPTTAGTTTPTTTPINGYTCPIGWHSDNAQCYATHAPTGPLRRTCDVNSGWHYSSSWGLCIKYIPATVV
jgi:beta-glucosidase